MEVYNKRGNLIACDILGNLRGLSMSISENSINGICQNYYTCHIECFKFKVLSREMPNVVTRECSLFKLF